MFGLHLFTPTICSLTTDLLLYIQETIRVVVTGAAGQIAYSLLYQLAKGDVFGADQPLSLHLLDIEPMMGVLNGEYSSSSLLTEYSHRETIRMVIQGV